MSKAGYSYSTVNCYLSGLSHFQKLNQCQDNTQNFIVKKLMDGMKRSTQKLDKRLPITRELLVKILGVLPAVCTSHYEASLFAAAFSLAFHGLFRVGELTVGNKLANHTIQYENIKLWHDRLELNVQTSKTDQFGKGQTLVISKQLNVAICPVQTLSHYLNIRPLFSGPLFCHFNGQPLSGYQFRAIMKKSLGVLGVENAGFKSHSFRIGMATTLSLEGFTDDQIMVKGRWKSDCFKRYIRI